MADRYAGYLGHSAYSRKDNADAALRKQVAKSAEVVEIAEKPLMIVEPNPDWCSEALMLWNAAWCDEASEWFSSGDVAILYMLCNQYHTQLRSNKPSAYALEVILKGLSDLRLSDRAKKQDGILVVRGEPELSDQERVIRLLEGTEEDG